MSLFLVPTDAEGLVAQPLPVDAMLPERQFTLSLDDVRVGPEMVVGEVGAGFAQVFHGLNPERITGAALCVGIARYALGRAAAYATERTVWKAPIGTHQGVSHPRWPRPRSRPSWPRLDDPQGRLDPRRRPAGRRGLQHGEVRRRRGRPGGGGRRDPDPRRQRPVHRVRPGALLGAARLLRIARSTARWCSTTSRHTPSASRARTEERTPCPSPPCRRTSSTGSTSATPSPGPPTGCRTRSPSSTASAGSPTASWTGGPTGSRTPCSHAVGTGGTPSGWPAATAPSSSPSTTPAPRPAWSACRSTWAGAPPRPATSCGTPASAGWCWRPSSPTGSARRSPTSTACRRGGRPGHRGAVPGVLAGRNDDHPRRLHRVRGRAVEVLVAADRAPLTYLYTSGTTSAPKGVVGNHLAVYVESTTMALEARWTDDDRFLAMMPMFHTAQLNCFCTPAVLLGATLVVHRGFDPDRFLDTVEAEGITRCSAPDDVPRAHRPARHRRPRTCPPCAGPATRWHMPEAQLRRAMEVFGCEFFLLFGQTEMSPTTTLFRPEHQLTHAGAVGTPTVGVRVALMGPDGELLRRHRGRDRSTAARRPSPSTCTTRRPPRPRSPAAGSTPGTSAASTTTACSGSRPVQGRDQDRRGRTSPPSRSSGPSTPPTPDIAEVVAVGLPHERWWTEASPPSSSPVRAR